MANQGQVMILPEFVEEKLHPGALELCALARRLADGLGGKASALLLQAEPDEAASDLITHGLDTVYCVHDRRSRDYHPEVYLAAAEKTCRQISPDILLLSHTLCGRDLAPRLAFRLKTVLFTDGVAFEIEPASKSLLVTRPVWGSKAMGVYNSAARPQIVTVRRKIVQPAPTDRKRTGEIVPLEIEIDPDVRLKPVKKIKQQLPGPKLEDAEIVVSGGRGVGSAENFKLLEKLASVLSGAVGATRAAVDNGWAPSSQQVGISGVMVSPRLYLAVALSGSSQHLAGCGSSQNIVCINTDPDAPIFGRSRFGVAADYKQVLPALIKLLS